STIPGGTMKTHSEETTSVDRRDWMKQAASLIGGAAAGAAGVAAVAEPAAMDAPAPEIPTRVTTSDAGVVETTAGKVRGFTRNGVYIFRGIPYGDTTAGENRFLPPQKAKPWTRVSSSARSRHA